MEESDPPSPPGRDDFQGGRSPGGSSKKTRVSPYERIPRREPRTSDTPRSMVSDGATTSSIMAEPQPPSTSQSDDFLISQQIRLLREYTNPQYSQNPGPSDRRSSSERETDRGPREITGSHDPQTSIVKTSKPTSPTEPGSRNKQDSHQMTQKPSPSNTTNRHHPYERIQATEDQDPKASSIIPIGLPPCFGKERCNCFQSLLDVPLEESFTIIDHSATLLPLHGSRTVLTHTTSPSLSPSEGLTSDPEPPSSGDLPETPRIQDLSILDDQESVTVEEVPQKQEGDDLKTSTSDVSTLDDPNLKGREENVVASTSRFGQIPSVPVDYIEPKERADDSPSSDSETNLETVVSPTTSSDSLQGTVMLPDSPSLNIERSEDQESVPFAEVPCKKENDDLEVHTDEIFLSDDLNIKECVEIDQREDDIESSEDPEMNLDPFRSSTPLKGLKDMQLLGSSLPDVVGPQDQESAIYEEQYVDDSKSSSKHDHSYASTYPESPESPPKQDPVYSGRAYDSEITFEQPGSPTLSLELLQATPMITDSPKNHADDSKSSSKHDHSYASTYPGSPESPPKQEPVYSGLADDSEITLDQPGSPTLSLERLRATPILTDSPKSYVDDSKSSSKQVHSYASTYPGSPESPPRQDPVHFETVVCEEPYERVDDSTSTEDSEMKSEQPESPAHSSESLQATPISTDSAKPDDDSKSLSSLDESPKPVSPDPSYREALAYLQLVSESFMNMDTSKREESPEDDGFKDRDVSSSDDDWS